MWQRLSDRDLVKFAPAVTSEEVVLGVSPGAEVPLTGASVTGGGLAGNAPLADFAVVG
jgi:hypothetical protein